MNRKTWRREIPINILSDPQYTRKSERVESYLDRMLPDAGESPDRLHRAMRYMTMGDGKRVRPVFTLATASILGGTDERALPPAAAVELIHTYSLVHDDLPCMDDDDLRRGRDACHIAFDVSTAVLTGDALQTLAFEVLSGAESIPDPVKSRLIQTLSRSAGSRHLVGGQQLDLKGNNRRATEENVRDIHRRKTGALFSCSLEMGGLVAEVGEKQIEILRKAGHHMGLAFQITDDLLDESGSTEQMGKRTRKDREKGRLTYPSAAGMDSARREAKRELTAANDLIRELNGDTSFLEQLATFIVERDR